MVASDTRLLVVDDDPGIRDYLTNRLSMEGYTVHDAEDVDKALNVLHDTPDMDLILLDVIMPGQSGFDLLRMLKADPQYNHIPIIMVTALGLVQDKELAFRLGAGDYLTKPFDTREMLARIKTHISLKQKTDEITLSNQILTTMLATVPGIVYMKDAERKFLHVNQLFEEISGKKAAEITGRSDYDLFNQSLAESFSRYEDLIFKHGIPHLENLEEIKTASGDTRSIFFRRQPVKDSKGVISGLVGVGIDLTEQVILRNILSDREAFLSTLVNTFPARIWAINTDNLFTQQNSAHIERWGNLIGKCIDDIPTDEGVKEDWKNRCKTALTGKKSLSLLPEEPGAKGSAFLSWTLPISQNDDIIGVLGITMEIPDGMIHEIVVLEKDRGE